MSLTKRQTPKDMFSRDNAHIMRKHVFRGVQTGKTQIACSATEANKSLEILDIDESFHEKNCLRGDSDQVRLKPICSADETS